MKYHVAGKSYLQRETMNALEGRLDAARFRRIHRSTIVALDRIVRMSSTFNGEYVVVLRDGTRLRMSKGYQSRLQEWLR
jgi:two-component system LytT family response regulator